MIARVKLLRLVTLLSAVMTFFKWLIQKAVFHWTPDKLLFQALATGTFWGLEDQFLGADWWLATTTTINHETVLPEPTHLLEGCLKIKSVPPSMDIAANIHCINLPELPWTGALVGLYLGWRLIYRICLFNNWGLFLMVRRILFSQSVILTEAKLFCTRQHAIERVDAGKVNVVGWEVRLLRRVYLGLTMISQLTFLKRWRNIAIGWVMWNVVKLLKWSQGHSLALLPIRRRRVKLVVELGSLVVHVSFAWPGIAPQTVWEFVWVAVCAE